MESHFRTIAKTLSWRVWATIITFVIALLVTKKTTLAFGIGLGDTLFKLFAYYCHERMWNRIKYGRPAAPEYNI